MGVCRKSTEQRILKAADSKVAVRRQREKATSGYRWLILEGGEAPELTTKTYSEKILIRSSEIGRLNVFSVSSFDSGISPISFPFTKFDTRFRHPVPPRGYFPHPILLS